jgi:hypothetical protein
MVVYDRGASLPAAAAQLQQAGVLKVGIPPRDRLKSWQRAVGEVRSEQHEAEE